MQWYSPITFVDPDLFKPGVPRSLVAKEWQISNPNSAVARRAFKDGEYTGFSRLGPAD